MVTTPCYLESSVYRFDSFILEEETGWKIKRCGISVFVCWSTFLDCQRLLVPPCLFHWVCLIQRDPKSHLVIKLLQWPVHPISSCVDLSSNLTVLW
jgi:hypothetical protein